MPDREKVIKGLQTIIDDDWMCKHADYYASIISDALALLKEQEQVVRCKDCKECYFASNRVPTEQSYVCGKHGTDVSLEWFCADGEREEGR